MLYAIVVARSDLAGAREETSSPLTQDSDLASELYDGYNYCNISFLHY